MSLPTPTEDREQQTVVCRANGCESIGLWDKEQQRHRLRLGRCNKHYLRYKKYGTDYLPERNVASKHPLNIRWKNMRQRCLNKSHPRYEDWGGRGIEICDRWDDFWAYVDDISSLPNYLKKGYTLDRIDNEGNYEPTNMRWATTTEQNTNQRIRKDNSTGHKNLYYVAKENKWLVVVERYKERVAYKRFSRKDSAINYLEGVR